MRDERDLIKRGREEAAKDKLCALNDAVREVKRVLSKCELSEIEKLGVLAKAQADTYQDPRLMPGYVGGPHG